MNGFWYSIDNVKDVNIANNKDLEKYSFIKKIKKKIKVSLREFLIIRQFL